MGRLKIQYLFLYAFVVICCFTSCRNDDETALEHALEHEHVTTQKVDLQDFPEILDHVQSLQTKDRRLQIDPSSNPYSTATRDEAVVLLNIDLDNVVQSQDENDRSNFAISAVAETSQTTDEFRFLTYNLVVAEYAEEEYSFIVEYEYDRDWVAAQVIDAYDYATFTGFIRFYSIYGQFVQEHAYTNGQVQSTRGSDPCSDDGDDDPDPDPTGGDGPTVVITCGCEPSHNGGSSNSLCSCSLPDIIIIYNFAPDGDPNKDPLRSPDPCGPGPGGGDDPQGDGDGSNTLPDECFLPNGDPIDCENPDIPLTPEELQMHYFSLLTVLNGHIGPTFWEEHMEEVTWLGNNKKIASDILYLIYENNHSSEIFNLVMNTLANFITYSPSNYPGMNDGFPFEWWNDDFFIKFSGNLDIPADDPNNPNEIPNAKEAILFRIFPQYAALHIQNSFTALSRAQELAPTFSDGLSGLDDGKGDAFRHAFWNALGTAEFGGNMMKLFADAHEWMQSGLDVDMDNFNNEKGRLIAEAYGYTFSTSDITISNGIEAAVYSGILNYIYGGVLTNTNLP
ncbi:hypothetical protein POV27_11485 [Aureisphaera galaxeae]|uniref:DUF6973 domain-containing protein n=1 Tax=Aureisphaera galaxeae TaxID=1538023 RepID=UPI002350E743|nr:hypothetical protein [Aureisphaera galaxeae]MDC8004674.1 hypothetical protein [Aureisphaera galaxeae]